MTDPTGSPLAAIAERLGTTTDKIMAKTADEVAAAAEQLREQARQADAAATAFEALAAMRRESERRSWERPGKPLSSWSDPDRWVLGPPFASDLADAPRHPQEQAMADPRHLPDPTPWPSYLLTALAVVVFYAGTRVDTDSTSTHRRQLTTALFVLSAALLLVGFVVAALTPAP